MMIKSYCNELENLPLGCSVNNTNSNWRLTDDWKPVISTLKGSSMTHAFFDIFRPLSEYNEKEQSCKTDFLVLFRYCQVRPNQSGASKDGDIGVQEYRGSAKVLPYGNKHPGNKVTIAGSINDTAAIISNSKALLQEYNLEA